MTHEKRFYEWLINDCTGEEVKTRTVLGSGTKYVHVKSLKKISIGN